MKPLLNEKKCPAMGDYCPSIQECPEKAISYLIGKSALLGGWIDIYLNKCNECGICVPKYHGPAIEFN